MKSNVTMRIDDDLKKDVQEIARGEGYTFSGIVSTLLKKWVKEKKNGRNMGSG